MRRWSSLVSLRSSGQPKFSNRQRLLLQNLSVQRTFQFVSRELRQRSGRAQLEAGSNYGLTYRQRQLVVLVAKGLTNKEIAASLNLSEFTVKNHIRRILRQVDAQTRYEAVDVIRASGYLPSA